MAENQPTPHKPRRIPPMVLMVLAAALALLILSMGSFALGSNDGGMLFLLLFVGLVFLVVPAVVLTEQLTRSRLGRALRGKPVHTPIYRSNRFWLFLRYDDRPWWVLPALFFGVTIGMLILLAIGKAFGLGG